MTHALGGGELEHEELVARLAKALNDFNAQLSSARHGSLAQVWMLAQGGAAGAAGRAAQRVVGRLPSGGRADVHLEQRRAYGSHTLAHRSARALAVGAPAR